jgi:nitrogenase molybdenum-iron protein NifN
MADRPDYVSTTNACRVCMPLGACLAFKGVRGAVPFLHGSQGCATYMRRYLISHFREPVDIASSSLGEREAVYGGAANLKEGLRNVLRKYRPEVVGIATTCLTETIGDDVAAILGEFRREDAPETKLVRVSTPSYQGDHAEGFHAAVLALVEAFAEERAGAAPERVNLLPGPVSPADLRHLKEIAADFGLAAVVLPDYADTLDGPATAEPRPLPAGGTSVGEIAAMGGSRATLELGRSLTRKRTAGTRLEERHGVSRISLGLPVGLRETDRFFAALEALTGRGRPASHEAERGRLVDAYVDGHKYLAGRRAALVGDEDLTAGLAAFLAEIGVQPVLCATGAESRVFGETVAELTGGLVREPARAEAGIDFAAFESLAREATPDFLLGSSKAYPVARKLGVPLVRVGFPIHDRFGGQRTLHVGYRGAQALYDRIVNALLERAQDGSAVGYGYL